MRLVFDIEANNLRTATKIHCICIQDADTKEEWRFGPDRLQEALALLSRAKVLIAHNGLGYDFFTIAAVLGWRPPAGIVIIDTLLESRIRYSDFKENDFRGLEGENKGSHSLDAWGAFLGQPKTHYEGGWEEWSQEMEDYCMQDVRVCTAILLYFEDQPYKLSKEVVKLEQTFAVESEVMSRRGFPFNKEKGEKLAADLEVRAAALVQKFKQYAPDRFENGKKPQYWTVAWPDGTTSQFPTKGAADDERKARKVKPKDCQILAGPLTQKKIEFNLNSDKQVRDYLVEKYGWISPALTETGEKLLKEGGHTYDELAKNYGSVGEDILRTLDFPEAEIIADYAMIMKLHGQVKSGPKSWFNSVQPDGKIHHSMITIGAVTFRCAHSNCNLGQIPSVSLDKEGHPLMGMEGRFGYESRDLFEASEGYVLCGTDLSGIEARCLAHFLHRYDKGKYVDLVLSGDVHQKNADEIKRLAGYSISRKDAKTPLYGWMYGGGHLKLGKVVVSTTPDAKAEFQELNAELLRGNLSTARINQIASLVRWGTDRPENSLEERYSKMQYMVRKCNDVQQASWLAYSAVGGRIDNAFRKGTEGMAQLLTDVQKSAARGYLTPLDGRRIPVRHTHAALNTLLQGSARIVFARWITEAFKKVRKERLDCHLLSAVHDETQTECRPEHVEKYQEIILGEIPAAGRYYKFHIPLSGESKLGRTWAETH